MKRDLTIVICLIALMLSVIGYALYNDSRPTAKNWSHCMLEEMDGQPAIMYPIAEIQCERYREDDLLERMV